MLLFVVGYVSHLAIRAEGDARRALDERFAGRADLGAAFLSSYVDEVFGPAVAAVDLDETSLAEFLSTVTPIDGQRSIVVDDTGEVVASSAGGGTALEDLEPGLPVALATAPDGTYEGADGATQRYAARPIGGTPWSLVTVAPENELHAPLASVERSTVLVVALLVLVAGWLLRLLAVSRRRAAQLAVLAATDPLTGTGNRRTLEAWQADRDAEAFVAVLVVDLDHFKAVNDRFGHRTGDDVLRAVASRLRRAVRDGDAVVRWGGEEFAVLLCGASADVATGTAERLRRAVCEPIACAGAEVRVTASVGVAGGTAAELAAITARADAALYEAKAAGRDRVVVAGPVVTTVGAAS